MEILIYTDKNSDVFVHIFKETINLYLIIDGFMIYLNVISTKAKTILGQNKFIEYMPIVHVSWAYYLHEILDIYLTVIAFLFKQKDRQTV